MTENTSPVQATINEWTDRNGQTRRYINNLPEIIGLDVDRYKTGNIASATVNGESISNAAAGRLLGVKVWLDANDKVHVDYWRDGTERHTITKADVIAAVEAAMQAGIAAR